MPRKKTNASSSPVSSFGPSKKKKKARAVKKSSGALSSTRASAKKTANTADTVASSQGSTLFIHRAPESCSYPTYAPVVRRTTIVSTRTTFVLGLLTGIAFMTALTFLSFLSLYSTPGSSVAGAQAAVGVQ